MTAAIEQLILRRLAKGPVYARTFHLAKPVVNRLVAQGKVRRIASDGSRIKNMIALVETDR